MELEVLITIFSLIAGDVHYKSLQQMYKQFRWIKPSFGSFISTVDKI